MEELETLESTECPECPGPPPEFRLPPPPRPPFLTEGSFCSEAPLADLEDCVAVPIIDASYHTNPSLQSTALIITCAVVVLLMAAIISVVFWKHKRKVQNLLPCKSAAGAAAARGGRILGDGSGQPRTVPMTGAAVLYEDLPDGTLTHSQLHNHHRLTPSGHHHQYQAPTIEVRRENLLLTRNTSVADTQRTPMRRLPSLQPHHFDYLDYRDPRTILRVSDKPSRAVLGGGYRTPRALLAKSQGVPISMAANHLPNDANGIGGGGIAVTGVTSPLLRGNDHHLMLARENSLITSQFVQNSTRIEEPYFTVLRVIPARPRDSGIPITPTHRPKRRSSIDSEGYSYIRYNSKPLPPLPNSIEKSVTIDMSARISSRSNSIDSEGYSYIVEMNNRTKFRPPSPPPLPSPGKAKRIVVVDGTEEEVCPLCTIQQIHNLLNGPEEIYYDEPSCLDNNNLRST